MRVSSVIGGMAALSAMDGRATGRPYTRPVPGRIVLLAALLVVSSACGSDDSIEARALPAAVEGPWQPVPFALPGPIIEIVDRACRAGFEDDFPQHTQMMVTDARGTGRVEVLYAAPNGDDASCTTMIDATGRVEWSGGGTGSRGQAWLVLPALELESIGGYGSREASATTGRAGAGIAKVVVVMPGKPQVTASLANGWYSAWLPGEWPPGTKVVGLDSVGQPVTETPLE
jgi:hypothetical protein